MKKRQPLIGITGVTTPDAGSPMTPFHSVRKSYLSLIEKKGGVPLILTSTHDTGVLDRYSALIDGLLISGGGDIHPSLYNRKKEAMTGKYQMRIDAERDTTELYLLKKMMRLNKPVVGICRGCQMINIGLGGTLLQDIKTAYPQSKEVHLELSDKNKIFQKRHGVVLETTSRLYALTGKKKGVINSAHHQAIENLGEGLAVAGRSEEGIIEAVESTDDCFLFGLQWHPEMLPDDPITQKLFEAFIDVA